MGPSWKKKSARASPAGPEGANFFLMEIARYRKWWMASRSQEWSFSDNLQENGNMSPIDSRKWRLPKPEWAWKTPSLRWNQSPGWHFDFNLVRPWAEDPGNLCLDSWPLKTYEIMFYFVLNHYICGTLLYSNKQLIHTAHESIQGHGKVFDS